MPPDGMRSDRTQDASPQKPKDAKGEMKARLRQRLEQSPEWQIFLALVFVLIAVGGLCRVSGVWDRLRPLPLPTATPTSLSTRTPTPTWTLTSTPAPTATATVTPVPVLMPGGQALVGGTGAQQLRVRSDPGLTHATLRTLEDGTRLKVLEGPEVADGHTWWKVQTDDGQEGWVAADWLVPVAP